MSNGQLLIEIYNKLDKFMEREYPSENYTSFSRRVNFLAGKHNLIGTAREDLLLLADIRNILVHESLPGNDQFLIPSDQLIEHFQNICNKITSPPNALSSLSVPAKYVYSLSTRDNVLDAIRFMHKKGFSHAPILQDNKIIGVLSENSVFSYVSEKGGIDPNLRVEALNETLSQSKSRMDKYRFAPPEVSIYAIEDIFKHSLETGSRVAVVFITSDGTSHGELLGMITNIHAAFFG